MRLLGVLAIVAPIMIGILLVYDPNLTAPWVVEGKRSDVAALMAITLAAASTAVLSWLIERIRFGRMVKAAERIGNDWVIDSGLKAGEKIVVEGVQKVRAGTKVTPVPMGTVEAVPVASAAVVPAAEKK